MRKGAADGPLEDMDRAEEAYRGHSGREYHETKRALVPAALPWVMELRVRKLQPHVGRNDTVLEFGAGAGWNLGRLQCGRKLAHDVSDFLKERLTGLGIEFVEDTASLPPNSLDVVICHHALEHLLNPALVLQDFLRLLKPGGKLVIHVPWERERRYRSHSVSEPNHHLYTWNAQTLGNLVIACGYRVELVRTRPYGYERAAGNLAAKLRLGEFGFHLIRRMLMLCFPLVEIELVALASGSR